MPARVVKSNSLREVYTSEGCYIAENSSSESISIARARVTPGTTTKLHHLIGVDEIYLITKGKGIVTVGSVKPTKVTPGDAVYIPADEPQKIENVGNEDLVFYCICSPGFTQKCYSEDEP